MPSPFITLEGGEGSGKTTQIALLEAAFNAAGIPCVKTREPGGSPGAEAVRNLVVNGDADSWDPMSETLLFCAARIDHVRRLILPSLEAGKVVICDRFFDSTMVYQGLGRGMPESIIKSLQILTMGSFEPTLTLILDIEAEVGLQRAAARRGGEGRFESMDINFHEHVRAGFRMIAETNRERCAVVDASGDAKSVHASIIALVNERLGFTLQPHG